MWNIFTCVASNAHQRKYCVFVEDVSLCRFGLCSLVADENWMAQMSSWTKNSKHIRFKDALVLHSCSISFSFSHLFFFGAVAVDCCCSYSCFGILWNYWALFCSMHSNQYFRFCAFVCAAYAYCVHDGQLIWSKTIVATAIHSRLQLEYGEHLKLIWY